jgi:DNA-binding NtrC family response regulator
MALYRLLLVLTGRGPDAGPAALDALLNPPGYCLLPPVEGVSAEILRSSAPHAVLISHSNDTDSALTAVRKTRALCAQVPIIFLAWTSCEALAIDAFHAGISRYLKYPWTALQLADTLHECVEIKPAPAPPVSEGHQLAGACPMIGTSPAICELRQYIAQIAPSESNVMITGETGTGKELVAHLVHENSSRRLKRMVCLNSASIPETLIESELFGYERGAFTGAQNSQLGKLAVANRGTLFLDEIGDISPGVQAKILRAVENREIFPLGSTKSQGLDIRILAATNQDLESAAAQNRFRTDLYYRLNVIKLEIPPLRDRIEDLPMLINHYIHQFNNRFRRNIAGLKAGSLDVLSSYCWPGNVRELRNVMEAAFVNFSCAAEGLVDLPSPVFRQFFRSAPFALNERTNLIRVLSSTSWNKTDAARALHCSRMTVYRKMSRYQVASPAATKR